MLRMNDIYFKVGSSLARDDFDFKNVEEKKMLVDKELKNYLIEKINENGTKLISESSHNDGITTNDLVEVLASIIPEDKHFDTLRHLTHFIVNIAGEMQGHSIMWWSENEDSYKNLPVASFNENGLWDDIHTHEDDLYVKTFEFVYDLFVNSFMKKAKVNKKFLNNSGVN